MIAVAHPARSATVSIWVGRILSALAILCLAFDTAIKVRSLTLAVDADGGSMAGAGADGSTACLKGGAALGHIAKASGFLPHTL